MTKKPNTYKNKVNEYIKFNIIGTSNFIVSQIIYLILHLKFNIGYIVAYIITSILSVVLSYYLNSRYTFKENTYSISKFYSSILIYVFEFTLNITIIIILVSIFKLNTVISPFIAPVFSTPVLFFMMRRIIKK